jgi:hypothetical protein
MTDGLPLAVNKTLFHTLIEITFAITRYLLLCVRTSDITVFHQFVNTTHLPLLCPACYVIRDIFITRHCFAKFINVEETLGKYRVRQKYPTIW